MSAPSNPPPPPSMEAIRGASDRNVEGYLRNVSAKAQHASAGEGGRGTKVRRTAAVTWGETRHLDAAAAVALGSTVKKKDETASPADSKPASPVASETIVAAPAAVVVVDRDPDDDDDDDDWEVVIKDDDTMDDDVKDLKASQSDGGHATATTMLKTAGLAEPTVAGMPGMPLDGAPTAAADGSGGDFMGARREQRQRGDSLWDLRQAAKARRWVEKNGLFAKSVAGFVCVVRQLHMLYRLAHHPDRARALLSLPPLQAAVDRAGRLLRETDDRAQRGQPSPAWVNAAKDGANTKVGAASHCIVQALNGVFASNLEHTPVPNASADADDHVSSREAYRAKTHIVAPMPASWGDPTAQFDPAQFCVAFMALAHRVGIDCRLCVAFALKDVVVAETVTNGANEAFDVRTQSGFKRKASTETKKPESSYWCEVWCDTKGCFVSVNPCKGVTTRWGAPHVLAYGGDHTVDVAPRYTSAWSKMYKGRIEEMHYTKGYLWPDEHEPEKPVTVYAFSSRTRHSATLAVLHEIDPLQRLLWPMCRDVSERTFDRLTVEAKHLVALKYSEAIPTKIQDFKGHPLFVLEGDITRYEGIYPKNASTTVGYLKGRPVYRRDAVHALRSRMGWLRLNRMVPDGEEAYRVVPPPPNRPLVSPSQMFGRWQTVEFQPKPINADGSIPRHYGTSWYMMLNVPRPGEGLTHITGEGVESVARRIHCTFALAVVGFEKKQGPMLARGKWTPLFKGVVVADATVPALSRAHSEWIELKRAKEAAARRKRAMGWWKRLIQLGLSRLRVQQAYVHHPRASL